MRLSGAAESAVRVAGTGGRRAWDALVEAAPRVPVRDLATLRAHHHGLEGEDLADALVRGAMGSVAIIGVAGGFAALSTRRVPGWFLAVPVTVAAEAVVIAAVEAKLIAELHEVYGVPLRPGARSRGSALLAEWAARRDLDPTDPRSLRVLTGLVVRQRGVRQVARSGGRVARLGSAVVGGAAGAGAHRRNVDELAESLRTDLRRSRRNRLGPSGWLF